MSPAMASGRVPHNLLLNANAVHNERKNGEQPTTPGRGQIMSYLTKMAATPGEEEVDARVEDGRR